MPPNFSQASESQSNEDVRIKIDKNANLSDLGVGSGGVVNKHVFAPPELLDSDVGLNIGTSVEMRTISELRKFLTNWGKFSRTRETEKN